VSGAAILFSRDPGGTNQLIALHGVLSGAEAPPSPDLAALVGRLAGAAPRVFAKDQGLEFWRRAGIEATAWDGELAHWSPGPATALLTATSDVDDRSPQALWGWAAGQGLFSAAFVDGAATPDQRFRDAAGRRIMPDLIFAADPATADALAAAGLPMDRLRQAGPLHLLRVRMLARAVSPERIAALRARWGATPGERVLLFASDCGREIVAAGRTMPYDEVEGLQRLLAHRGGARVVVRPHPKDRPGKYDAFAAPDVRISGEEDSIAAILSADLVVGMDSTLLVEAEALGRPAVSLWPRHRLYRGEHV
jgi:hypothetical protein